MLTKVMIHVYIFFTCQCDEIIGNLRKILGDKIVKEVKEGKYYSHFL